MTLNNHIQLIYPRNNANITASSTFFVGNTNPKSTLTINNEPVKVYSNGAFVRVFHLNKGKNIITLKSNLNGKLVTKQIIINVPTSKSKAYTKKQIVQPLDKKIYIQKKEIACRKTPYGDRLTPLKQGCFMKATGIVDNHYKIKLDDNNIAYVKIDDVSEYTNNSNFEKQEINKLSISENQRNILMKAKLVYPTPIDITNVNNKFKLKIYNSNVNLTNVLNKSPYVKNITGYNDIIEFELNADNAYGYDYYFEGNDLIFSMQKPFSKGVRGKTITIDAGHGGQECGAIGPTNVKEKEINLQISKYLKSELEKLGANVVMTRENDTFVNLYDRVDIAQKAKSDLLISIHNNSLPDGENPYVTHGTTTYYYQPQAKKLAEVIQKNLLLSTKFKNQGIKTGSFVLTRPTNPVSILIEVGFMINPFEYEKLIQDKYQKEYAIGIKNGIVEYFNN